MLHAVFSRDVADSIKERCDLDTIRACGYPPGKIWDRLNRHAFESMLRRCQFCTSSGFLDANVTPDRRLRVYVRRLDEYMEIYTIWFTLHRCDAALCPFQTCTGTFWFRTHSWTDMVRY